MHNVVRSCAEILPVLLLINDQWVMAKGGEHFQFWLFCKVGFCVKNLGFSVLVFIVVYGFSIL